MKTGIEAFALQKNSTGIGNYTYQLLRSLGKSDNEDFSAYIYMNRAKQVNMDFGRRIDVAGFNAGGRVTENFYRTCLMSRYVNKTDIDVYHGTAFYIPKGLKKPSVITVHDLALYKYPKTFKRTKLLYARLCMPDSIRRADRIIAVSENTKKDVVDIFGVREEKVKVIYEAADEMFDAGVRDEEAKKLKSKLGIDKYILSVGTLEPRKNLMSLLQAFADVIPLLPEDIKLVIAGRKGWLYEDILKTIGDIGGKVVVTGYVTKEELRLLYNEAEVFVYPSLYEGFGLPVIEAMACGAPVITSNTSSLPEVAGDAGITVDPCNTGALSEAILEVVKNRKLREELSGKGLQRANLFSWEITAKQTLNVYSELC